MTDTAQIRPIRNNKWQAGQTFSVRGARYTEKSTDLFG
jgi:hypothetical protein